MAFVNKKIRDVSFLINFFFSDGIHYYLLCNCDIVLNIVLVV